MSVSLRANPEAANTASPDLVTTPKEGAQAQVELPFNCWRYVFWLSLTKIIPAPAHLDVSFDLQDWGAPVWQQAFAPFPEADDDTEPRVSIRIRDMQIRGQFSTVEDVVHAIYRDLATRAMESAASRSEEGEKEPQWNGYEKRFLQAQAASQVARDLRRKLGEDSDPLEVLSALAGSSPLLVDKLLPEFFTRYNPKLCTEF